MGEPNNIKDLFERYAYQVGQHLPKRKQKDIQMEILSSLEDALDDRAKTEGRDADEEMVVAVIKEFGPPSKVAASYRPHKFLIGPRFYQTFTEVVKIFLIIVAALFLMNIIARVGDPDQVLISMPGLHEIIDSLTSWALKTLGIIVVVFAIMEFKMSDLDEKTIKRLAGKSQPLLEAFGGIQYLDNEDWNPRKLPKTKESVRINRSKLILSSVWLFFLIVLFNFFPQWVGLFIGIDNAFLFIPIIIIFFTSYMVWIGFYRGMKLILYLWLLFVFGLLASSYLSVGSILEGLADGRLEFIPLLAASFSAYFIWISLYWGSKMLHNIWMLLIGQKTKLTCWTNIALKIFGMLILFYMYSGPTFIGLNPEYLSVHDIPTSTVSWFKDLFESTFNTGINLVIIAVLYIIAIQTVLLVIKEVRGRKSKNLENQFV